MTHRPFVPRYLLQPFDIKYLRDDLHVIAFFQGHSEYEAVETMLCLDDRRRPVIRAILTRHDQSQIDYINDEATYNSAVLSGREAELQNIDSEIDLVSKLPRVKVGFQSNSGEQVLMEVICASPPDASRGGVSDPGQHSASSSLPVMLRGKSALAGAHSRVEISGVRYNIPEKLRAGPHFVAHHGFFTVSHHMALVRAGERSFNVLSLPKTFNVGEAWVYDFSGEQKRYEIQSCSAASDIVAACSTGGYIEEVKVAVRGEGLEIAEISMHPERYPGDGVVLTFEGDGAFSMGVDAQYEAVAGVMIYSKTNAMSLCPKAPAWARCRNVKLSWVELGNIIRVQTSVTIDA